MMQDLDRNRAGFIDLLLNLLFSFDFLPTNRPIATLNGYRVF